jgi:signal peptidase I
MDDRSMELTNAVIAEDERRQHREGQAARQALFWLGLALAFLLITGTMLEARMIPTRSMERTLLVGDHLLISRFGYDATVPFSHFHWRLWREPRRSQLILFRAPIPGPEQGFIERLIGMPGDTIEIRRGVVYVNDAALAEPYRSAPPAPTDHYGPVIVPAASYFFLGDNRNVSFDSRQWGFVPEANIMGAAFVIYMSIEAPYDAWQPGELRARLEAYLDALLHPRLVRWHRLFTLI